MRLVVSPYFVYAFAGVCTYIQQASGDVVSTCNNGDPTCYATCFCNPGFFGDSCLYDEISTDTDIYIIIRIFWRTDISSAFSFFGAVLHPPLFPPFPYRFLFYPRSRSLPFLTGFMARQKTREGLLAALADVVASTAATTQTTIAALSSLYALTQVCACVCACVSVSVSSCSST